MSNKKSLKELQAILVEANEMVPANSFWRHYKGGEYEVLCIAFDEETLDFEVVYKPVGFDNVHFTRRMSAWLETVEWQGATLPRFEHLANS